MTSAGNPSRSPPRHRTSGVRRSDLSKDRARAPVERELECLELGECSPRRRPGEHRPHARPDRPRRVGIGASGPEDQRPVGEGVDGPEDRPDVPGIADAVQVDAQVARRAGSSSGGRPRSRACPIRARARRPATRARRPDPPRGTNSTAAPARSAASTRSSPSAANRPSRSRCFRARSLRISLSFSLWGLVIISSVRTKKGGLHLQAAREVRMEPSRLGRDGLPG